MTAEPDPVATPLPGGLVLLGPAGVLVVAAALGKTRQAAKASGYYLRSDSPFQALQRVIEVAAGSASRTGAGTTGIRSEADGAVSARVDVIGVTEAAVILGCTPRWVRARCERGGFVTAHRRGRQWRLARREVLAATW